MTESTVERRPDGTVVLTLDPERRDPPDQPPAKARRIVASNRKIGAQEPLASEIADAPAEPEKALAGAVGTALEDASGAPLPRAAGFARDVDAARDDEQRPQPRLQGGEDATEGRKAFPKRLPRPRGR